MAKIKKILSMENHGSYAKILIKTDSDDEAVVFVGGAVEIFFDAKYNTAKAFVKKKVD